MWCSNIMQRSQLSPGTQREMWHFKWMDASLTVNTSKWDLRELTSRPSHSPGISSRPSHSPRSAQNLGMQSAQI
ncbi:hypothetical protein Tco_0271463, partial [Tanacetum coccineum]